MRKTFCFLLLVCITLSPLFAQNKHAGPYMTEKQRTMEEKLRKIIVPEVNFEDADIVSVVKYLSELSAKLSGDGQKVNIVVAQSPEDKKNKILVTLALTNIPLYDVLNYMAMLTGMTMRVDEYAVILKKAPPKQPEKKQ